MKYPVTTFVSMKAGLKELEPFIRNGKHLETGKPFRNFGGLRSREILGNWLLCSALNFELKSDCLRICTDPQGGDGIIVDKRDNHIEHMEHILISRNNSSTKNTETLILEHINKKRKKGEKAYASGKSLVVFINKKGCKWTPNRLAKKLPLNLYFNGVWVIGLENITNGKYLYNVVKLDISGCPIWQVMIKSNFKEWLVKRIQ